MLMESLPPTVLPDFLEVNSVTPPYVFESANSFWTFKRQYFTSTPGGLGAFQYAKGFLPVQPQRNLLVSLPAGKDETENRSSRNPPHASKASPAGNLSTKRRQPTTMSLSRFIFSVVDDDQCRRDQNEDSKPRDPADVQRH